MVFGRSFYHLATLLPTYETPVLQRHALRCEETLRGILDARRVLADPSVDGPVRDAAVDGLGVLDLVVDSGPADEELVRVDEAVVGQVPWNLRTDEWVTVLGFRHLKDSELVHYPRTVVVVPRDRGTVDGRFPPGGEHAAEEAFVLLRGRQSGKYVSITVDKQERIIVYPGAFGHPVDFVQIPRVGQGGYGALSPRQVVLLSDPGPLEDFLERRNVERDVSLHYGLRCGPELPAHLVRVAFDLNHRDGAVPGIDDATERKDIGGATSPGPCDWSLHL